MIAVPQSNCWGWHVLRIKCNSVHIFIYNINDVIVLSVYIGFREVCVLTVVLQYVLYFTRPVTHPLFWETETSLEMTMVGFQFPVPLSYTCLKGKSLNPASLMSGQWAGVNSCGWMIDRQHVSHEGIRHMPSIYWCICGICALYCVVCVAASLACTYCCCNCIRPMYTSVYEDLIVVDICFCISLSRWYICPASRKITAAVTRSFWTYGWPCLPAALHTHRSLVCVLSSSYLTCMCKLPITISQPVNTSCAPEATCQRPGALWAWLDWWGGVGGGRNGHL